MRKDERVEEDRSGNVFLSAASGESEAKGSQYLKPYIYIGHREKDGPWHILKAIRSRGQ